jgi:AAA15 family ATPase/GTPase
LGYASDLTDYYSEHIQRDSELKQKFIESLQVIIPDLADVLIDTAIAYNPVLIIQRKGQRKNMPLATFGDGFTNLFRLMIEIYRNEGKRIMLDEIDYGVHFDRKTGFWKAILHAAQSNQVQIFATTHNNECISSLQEAGNDDSHAFGTDIRIIRLAEVKNKDIKANTFNFDQFTHAIENENELR